MRLIDADLLRKNMEFICMGIMAGTESYNSPLTEIDNAPTVPLPDFKEGYKQAIIDGKTNFSRQQGEWYFNYQNGWHCSICNRSVKDMPTVMGKADFNFCPNCGAEMKVGAE